MSVKTLALGSLVCTALLSWGVDISDSEAETADGQELLQQSWPIAIAAALELPDDFKIQQISGTENSSLVRGSTRKSPASLARQLIESLSAPQFRLLEDSHFSKHSRRLIFSGPSAISISFHIEGFERRTSLEVGMSSISDKFRSSPHLPLTAHVISLTY